MSKTLKKEDEIYTEVEKNLFFRGGSPFHVFEYGQTVIESWQDKSEIQVLCERVVCNVKPFASYVIQNGDGLGAPFTGLELVKMLKLQYPLIEFRLFRNKWNVLVLNFCLKSNIDKVIVSIRPDIPSDSTKHFAYALDNGLDLSSDTLEECGIGYGYWE